MSKENHSVIRHFCQRSTKQGLRPPRKWFVVVVVVVVVVVRVVSSLRNPHHPKVSSPFSYNDNPKMADLFHGKSISTG